MNIPSLIFYAVFLIPLVIFLTWLMRQDKRKGVTGLIVLAIIVVGGIVYMYLELRGSKIDFLYFMVPILTDLVFFEFSILIPTELHVYSNTQRS